MGLSRRRRGQDGKPRYTAYHRDLRGRKVSAGTFARKADADAAWQAPKPVPGSADGMNPAGDGKPSSTNAGAV